MGLCTHMTRKNIILLITEINLISITLFNRRMKEDLWWNSGISYEYQIHNNYRHKTAKRSLNKIYEKAERQTYRKKGAMHIYPRKFVYLLYSGEIFTAVLFT